MSWKRQRCQINFSSGQKHKELKENGMKEEPLFALSVGGTCRLCESPAPHKLGGVGQLPSQGQILPGYGGGRQSPFYKALQDLTNESTKSVLPHLQIPGINGTNIWQVTSLQSFTSFAYCAHPTH